ncbi:cupin domain-containing protein [Roseobacteraceae bacterium S113]
MTGKLDILAETSNLHVVAERGDILSEILDILHVHGESALMLAPEGSQTVGFPSAMPCIHIVEHGEITIRIEGQPEPVTVSANQLALLLRGHAHHVDYGEGGVLTHIDKAIAQAGHSGKLQLGNNIATRCFWGSFSLYGDLANTVLRGLPPIIIIGDLKEDPIDFLVMVCQIILEEMQENRPGANAMVSRLLDLMLVQILRRWARNAETAPGWLASAQDERISRAVAAMHEDAAYDWNIEGLAELCGMSRSSFAALFEKIMRQAPGAYLRELRLTRAAKLLRYSGATIEIISEQVGYTSKEAFSRAFRNRFGKSPSTWRSSR